MPRATHTSAHWATHKPKIWKLYMEDRLPLSQVKMRMSRMTPAFIATDSEYKKRFKKWGWRKYKKAPQLATGSPEAMASYDDLETQVIDPQLQHLLDSIDSHGGYSHPMPSQWAESELPSTPYAAQQPATTSFEPFIDTRDLRSDPIYAWHLSSADQEYPSAGGPNAMSNSVPLHYPRNPYPDYPTLHLELYATPMVWPINEPHHA